MHETPGEIRFNIKRHKVGSVAYETSAKQFSATMERESQRHKTKNLVTPTNKTRVKMVGRYPKPGQRENATTCALVKNYNRCEQDRLGGSDGRRSGARNLGKSGKPLTIKSAGIKSSTKGPRSFPGQNG
ncbi:hypothetical protein FKM82_018604 [Ascaphus truei]